MRYREIPVDQWQQFFETFSRLHRHKPASVSTTGPGVGVHYNARDLPLMGVAAEALGANPRQIEIMLGELPDAHLVHTIGRPIRVRAAEWNDGYSAAVQVDSEREGRTVLRVGPEAEVLEPGVVMDDVVLDGE